MRRALKIAIRLGLLAVVVLAIKKILDSRNEPPAPATPPRPVPPRPVPAPAPDPQPEPEAEAVEDWVPEDEPDTEPVMLSQEDLDPESQAPDPQPDPEPAPEVIQDWVPEDEPDTEPVMPSQEDLDPESQAPEPESAVEPEPKPVKKAAKKRAPRTRKAPESVPPETPVGALMSWVEPVGDTCPPSHPIKAKLGSRVFRRPGGPGYDTSHPDRCYASEGAASRAGFKEAQR